MAIKNARKQSQDSAQEHLRTSKDKWNGAASELISKLIAFKRGLNGRGDSDYQLPVSSIKEPLPPEIGAFLNGLSSEFQNLVSGAGQIIQEQSNYSKTRRKKQAGFEEHDHSLIVEASNPITRALSRLTSIFKQDRYKTHRIALLELSSELYKDLVKMQDLIVSRNLKYEDFFKQDVKIKTGLRKMQDQFKILQQKIQTDNSPVKEDSAASPVEGNTSSPANPIPSAPALPKSPRIQEDEDDGDIDALMSKLNSYFPDIKKVLNIGGQDLMKLQEIHHQWKKSKNEIQKETSKDRFLESYRDFLDLIKLRLKDKKTDFKDSEDVEEVLVSSGLIQKKASNPISRFVKKKILTGPSKPIRIDIFEKIALLKKEVDRMSDDLESAAVSYDGIYEKFANIFNEYLSLKDLFASLKRYLYEGYQYGDDIISGKPRELSRRMMTEEVLKETRESRE